jgi:hypothetical protein
MIRDTYRDYATGLEVCECPAALSIRTRDLITRSGAKNLAVRHWDFRKSYIDNIDAVQVEIVFLSRSWTGR